MTAPRSASGVKAARRVITDRRGGVSEGQFATFNLGDHVGDCPESVRANRQRLASTLGLDERSVVWMDQVHGTRVATVDRPIAAPIEETDGLVTTMRGLALAVLTADCVPILAADDSAGVIAAVHAGREGATLGIVDQMLEGMRDSGAKIENIDVLLGPAASGKKYELPESMANDVERALPGSHCSTEWGTHGVDLRAGIAQRLIDVGVRAVRADPRCTISDRRLFSYRRDGVTGRFASVIWRP